MKWYLYISLLFMAHLSSMLGVEVNSDFLEITELDAQLSMKFSQNAIITGHDFCLTGDTINILTNQNAIPTTTNANMSSIEHIEAIQNAAFTEKNYHGTGDKITILPREGLLIVEGNGEIVDAENGSITGEKLIFDNKTKTVKIEGSANSRSVLTVNNTDVIPVKNENFTKKVDEGTKIQ